MKLVIKNGRVMDPASGRDEVTNIWVEDEKIIGFGEHPEWAEEAEELNAEGCVVAPGPVDLLVGQAAIIRRKHVEYAIGMRAAHNHAEVVQRQLEDLRLLFAWQIQNQL